MSDEQIQQTVLNGKDQMPANKKLDEDTLPGLIAYVRALAAGSGGTATVCAAPAEDIAKLYRAKCSSCHGVDGAGTGVLGKSLKVPDLTSTSVQSLPDDQLGSVVSDGRGKMRGYGSEFNAAQSKYPPAEPGALGCEPLKAAERGR